MGGAAASGRAVEVAATQLVGAAPAAGLAGG
jgi:hypothetical protein